MNNYHDLISRSNEDLRKVDPLVMNLLVARSIPSLSGVEISRYQRMRDEWAEALQKRLVRIAPKFLENPPRFRNDINFFRLLVLCEFVDRELGLAYKEDQRDVKEVYYTDPSDLFLNGVMDTRQGTCGNMAALHMVLAWRLGWPVSLACIKSHFICRYDDGKVTYNIEATQAGLGHGGMSSPSDAEVIEKYGLPLIAVRCGSDLRALTPRELLAVFIGFRGRHMDDTKRPLEAERDFLLARYLFPTNRRLYGEQTGLSVQNSTSLFEPGEHGSPQDLADWLGKQYGRQVSMAAQVVDTTSDTIFMQLSRGVGT